MVPIILHPKGIVTTYSGRKKKGVVRDIADAGIGGRGYTIEVMEIEERLHSGDDCVMRYQCPHCRALGEMKRKYLGRPRICPECEEKFTVHPFYGEGPNEECGKSSSPSGPSESIVNSTTSRLEPCPDCGETVSYRATQCPHCGAPVHRAAYDEDRFTLILFNLITAGLLLVFFAGLLFTSGEGMIRVLGFLILACFLSLRYHLFMLRWKEKR
jgi:uncharacterized protein (DUF983 family)